MKSVSSAGTAVKDIATRTAAQDVRAITAGEPVVAGAADQSVVAGAAIHTDVPGRARAIQHIVAGIAGSFLDLAAPRFQGHAIGVR